MTVQLYDTTLRDGAQMEGISLSVEDKLRIARKLDELGVHFIEGGLPGANPKDVEFFERMRDVKLQRQARRLRRRRAAPAATPRPTPPSTSSSPPAPSTSRSSARPATSRCARSSRPASKRTSRCSADSVRFLKQKGKGVFFDAEHFFDGFAADPDYALVLPARRRQRRRRRPRALRHQRRHPDHAACSRPSRSSRRACPACTSASTATTTPRSRSPTRWRRSQAGVEQVQACINGYGERCGNANMCQRHRQPQAQAGRRTSSTDEQLARLTEVSHFVSEVANLTPWPQQPYVGASAFAHKAGYHADGMIKVAGAYQHIDPGSVGNERRLLVSELGGSRGLLDKVAELGIDYPITRDEARRADRAHQGEGGARLPVRRRRRLAGAAGAPQPARLPAALQPRRLLGSRAPRARAPRRGRATTRCRPRRWSRCASTASPAMPTSVIQTAADGNGPVNALDAAVRKALAEFYPAHHRHPPGRLQGAHHRLGRPAPAPTSASSSSAADERALLADRRRQHRHHRGLLAGPGRRLRVVAPAPPGVEIPQRRKMREP